MLSVTIYLVMSSRRQYITSTYLTSYLSGTSINSDFQTEDDLISFAEEMIDSYVGPQLKWFRIASTSNAGIYTPPDWEPDVPVNRELRGRMAAVNGQTFTLQAYQQNAYQMDFFAWCWVEIIGGTGIGQTNWITTSDLSGVCTVQNAWTTTPDTTSVYRLYQLGKFPRQQDVYFDGLNQPVRYYKTIPEAVQRAVAAQCAYINRMGRAFFESDAPYMESQRLDTYSYKRAVSKGDPTRMQIAPEARQALRGIINRKGKIII